MSSFLLALFSLVLSAVATTLRIQTPTRPEASVAIGNYGQDLIVTACANYTSYALTPPGWTLVLGYKEWAGGMLVSGPCENRNASDFAGAPFSEWFLSAPPPPAAPGDVGTRAWLAWPPPGPYWGPPSIRTPQNGSDDVCWIANTSFSLFLELCGDVWDVTYVGSDWIGYHTTLYATGVSPIDTADEGGGYQRVIHRFPFVVLARRCASAVVPILAPATDMEVYIRLLELVPAGSGNGCAHYLHLVLETRWFCGAGSGSRLALESVVAASPGGGLDPIAPLDAAPGCASGPGPISAAATPCTQLFEFTSSPPREDPVHVGQYKMRFNVLDAPDHCPYDRVNVTVGVDLALHGPEDGEVHAGAAGACVGLTLWSNDAFGPPDAHQTYGPVGEDDGLLHARLRAEPCAPFDPDRTQINMTDAWLCCLAEMEGAAPALDMSFGHWGCDASRSWNTSYVAALVTRRILYDGGIPATEDPVTAVYGPYADPAAAGFPALQAWLDAALTVPGDVDGCGVGERLALHVDAVVCACPSCGDDGGPSFYPTVRMSSLVLLQEECAPEGPPSSVVTIIFVLFLLLFVLCICGWFCAGGRGRARRPTLVRRILVEEEEEEGMLVTTYG